MDADSDYTYQPDTSEGGSSHSISSEISYHSESTTEDSDETYQPDTSEGDSSHSISSTISYHSELMTEQDQYFPWEDLTNDLCDHIWEYVPILDRLPLRTVSRSFSFDIVRMYRPHLNRLITTVRLSFFGHHFQREPYINADIHIWMHHLERKVELPNGAGKVFK